MITQRFFTMRNAVILLLLLVIAALVYALAAANTVPPTYAGQGSNTISGYTVERVHYTPDTSVSPAIVGYVSFDLTPDADAEAEVYARVSGGGEDSGYVLCTSTRPAGLPGAWTREWYCNVGSGGSGTVTVRNADTLEVIALQ